jgi:hypothetical protein
MAKAKNLAGLAALGALGYMLNKKSYKEDAGDQKTSSYTGDTKKVEAKDVNYGNEGRRTSMGVAPAPKTTTKAEPIAKTPTTTKAEPIAKTPTTSKDPRNLEAGMTRGTRTTSKDPREAEAGMSRGTRTTSMAGAGRGFVNPPVPKPADPRSAEAGMSRGTRTTSMAGAGRGSVNPPVPAPKNPREAEAGMSRGTRTTSMAGAGRGSVNPPVPKPADPRSAEAGMSRGTRNMTPSPGQADIDKVRRIQETFRVPSSMAGRPGYDEAGNRMKHGGAVKMASGGMTASRRADGIATKGKTRGKIC